MRARCLALVSAVAAAGICPSIDLPQRAMHRLSGVSKSVDSQGTSGHTKTLVDLSDVRKMSLADNNVPVAIGMFQERRPDAGSSGSPGKSLSSLFGLKRNSGTVALEEVMQKQSAEAAHYLGTKSSAHSGQVQVHPSVQALFRPARQSSSDEPFWLRCMPDRCCAFLRANASPEVRPSRHQRTGVVPKR